MGPSNFASLYICVLATLLAPIVLAGPNYKGLFNSFKTKYQKTYSSATEEATRFKAFKTNVDRINEHNLNFAKGGTSFSLQVNGFADLTREEFASLYLDPKLASPSSSAPSRRADTGFIGTVTLEGTIPTSGSSFDWRTQGAVTAVKNQGACGSCWAFCTTGAVEGINFIKNRVLIQLSEQELLSCSRTPENYGCNGGWPEHAFDYIIREGGIASTAAYPYTARVTKCPSNLVSVASIDAYAKVPANNENQLLLATQLQPIAIYIDGGTDFQFYGNGIIDDAVRVCYQNLNHAVLVVGFGTSESGIDYWLVKNSWGTGWGEAGYVRIKRTSSGPGICGLATNPSYPLINMATNPTHYGPSSSGLTKCRLDEVPVTVTGVSGSFCAPACSSSIPCPTDFPESGTSLIPKCIVKYSTTSSTLEKILRKSTRCALVCTASSQCPTVNGLTATCKNDPITNIGICTY